MYLCPIQKSQSFIADVTTEGNEAMTITLAGADSNGASAGLPNLFQQQLKIHH